MKTRITYPQLWLDTDFCESSVETQLLFMFLITNPYLGLSRYTRLSDRQISFHTGLSGKKLIEAKNRLTELKWCFFYEERVYHNHNCAYVDYTGRDRVVASKEDEILKVPEEVKEVFNGLITGFKPVLNHKPKTINQKEGGVGETKKPDPVRAVAEHLISVFNQEFEKKYTLTPKRYQLISQRSKTFSASQLEEAVRKLGKSPWHRGKNDSSWVADPDFLFRSDENVDKALNLEVKRRADEPLSYDEVMRIRRENGAVN